MVSLLNTIRPTPFQEQVLAVPETHWLMLGGGRGGGKTHALCFLIIRHCEQYKVAARVLVTRKRLKSLGQFAEELRVLLRGAYGKAVKYNANESIFRLPNGATIQLSHCESQSALSDIAQGMSYTLIGVDEAGEAPSIATIDQLALALRGQAPPRMILAANPAGPNHSALADRYVKHPWAPFDVEGITWVYAPSVVTDNPHLPAEYLRNFEMLKRTDLALYEAHRFGRWDAIVGDYFSTSWDAARMTYDHHEVPLNCFRRLQVSIDWGSAAPCGVILGGQLARDVRLSNDRAIPKNAWLIHDEHLECEPNNIARGTGATPGQIAPRIHAMCRRNNTRAVGVIDSSAEARFAGYAQASVSDLFRAAGVRVRPATKGPRVPRFEKMKELMYNGDFYVASRCRRWLSTVPTLPRDPRHPEDVDTTSNDHMLDATSYLLSGQSPQAQCGNWREPAPMPPDERIVVV